jgi:arsenite transporter
MFLKAMHGIARHGREMLVAGLLAGLVLPGVAAAVRPYIPELVASLLFLTALRIGPKAAFGGARAAQTSLGLVLTYQLLAPLVVLGLIGAIGVAATPLGLVVVLMLAAPSVTGAPNFAILMGQDPAPALRMLLLGTALLPFTVLPVFWALPALGPVTDVFLAAGKLLGVITFACVAGFGLHALLSRKPDVKTLDGATAILLAVVVVGLMSALGPALKTDPLLVMRWLLVALVLNFGLQIMADRVLRRLHHSAPAGPAIIAGNRNIALFLVALPPHITEPLMIFIGCYQIPMYLTPILMRPLHARALA